MRSTLSNILYLIKGIIGKRFILLLFLSLISGLLDALGITMLFPLIESLDTSSAEMFGDVEKAFRTFFDIVGISYNLTSILIFMLVLFIGKGVLKFVEGVMKFRIKTNFARTIRYKMYYLIAKMRFLDFLKIPHGDINNTLTIETNQTSNAFNAFMDAALAVFTTFAYVFIAFRINWHFSAFTIFTVLFISIFVAKLNRSSKSHSYTLALANSKFQTYMLEYLAGIKYLKTTDTFSKYNRKVKQSIDAIEKRSFLLGKNISLLKACKEPIIMISIIGLIVTYSLLSDDKISGIILVFVLFYRALDAIMLFQTMLQKVMLLSGSVANVKSRLIKFEEKSEKFDYAEIPFNEHIRVNINAFNYSKEVNVLNDITLKFQKNKTYAFVGKSGSGKTTLIDILTTLIVDPEIEIAVDGKAIVPQNVLSWRSKFGFVTQEPILFSDSIRNNLAMWDDTISEDRIWEVLDLVDACDFVKQTEGGLNTMLIDNANNLSGGQRQRLVLARELLKKPEILVLDEATSALDTRTEKYIQESMKKMKGKLTIFMIAHRLSTIKEADEIFVLDKGSIVEQGTYEELLEKKGEFAYLNKL